MNFEVATMDDRLHRAMLAWQERHFRDFKHLRERWGEHYRQEPFRLVAKMSELKNPAIEVGDRAGAPKFTKTKEMDEETLERCRAIIRAQASTELGSIQQHRQTLHKAQDPRLQFDVLRVMAEEFRHGYQMMYLLAADDWGANVAQDAIEELLSMDTGSHVLDAFNVYFDSFVDNVVFAAVIDRVGKYQLSMQRVFAYAPMAQSMTPMLVEEAFHLRTGVEPLKQWVRDATLDCGNVPIASVQRHLNKWIPRGMEMFGDERGGQANVRLGLKDLANREAAKRYHAECGTEVIDVLNVEIVRTRLGTRPRDEALTIAQRVLAGDAIEGLRPEDLLRLPAAEFYRRRGEHAFQMVDVAGNPIADMAEYLRRLRHALPEAYVAGRDFAAYVDHLRSHRAGEQVVEGGMPFYG